MSKVLVPRNVRSTSILALLVIMSPSPPTYTAISDESPSNVKNEPLFIASVVGPYALLSLLILTPLPFLGLLPFLVLSSVVHFYIHPYTISRLFPSLSPESLDAQNKVRTAGKWQFASLLVLALGFVWNGSVDIWILFPGAMGFGIWCDGR
jgi:hypothetical protein